MPPSLQPASRLGLSAKDGLRDVFAMAAAGRRKVDEYSWPRVTQRIVSYYERLLDDHASHERLLSGRSRPWARRR